MTTKRENMFELVDRYEYFGRKLVEASDLFESISRMAKRSGVSLNYEETIRDALYKAETKCKYSLQELQSEEPSIPRLEDVWESKSDGVMCVIDSVEEGDDGKIYVTAFALDGSGDIYEDELDGFCMFWEKA